MRFCPLFSGSSGNAAVLDAGGKLFLIDAGISARRICAAMEQMGFAPENLSAIFITHEHIDHTRGIGVLARRLGVPVYATEGTWSLLPSCLGTIPESQVRIISQNVPFFMGDVQILPFAIMHDAAEPVGYTFFFNGNRVSVLTDSGIINENMLCAVANSDILLIESNHDVEVLKAGAYPYPLKRRILGERGHLSNDACGQALCTLFLRGVKRAILGHLSLENNTETLALATVRCALRDANIQDFEFSVDLARRDGPLEVYEI